MRLRQASRHSPQTVSPSRRDAHSSSVEPFSIDGPSRHDAQMLTARKLPADPYQAWLDEREANGRPSIPGELAPFGEPSRVAQLMQSRPTGRRKVPC
jgi:hypothetical protein